MPEVPPETAANYRARLKESGSRRITRTDCMIQGEAKQQRQERSGK